MSSMRSPLARRWPTWKLRLRGEKQVAIKSPRPDRPLKVAGLARETVTVALSGDGADEAFAGYRRQVFHAHEEQARGWLPPAFRRSLFGILGSIYPKADWAPRALRLKTTLLSLAGSGAEGYARALSVTPPEVRRPLYTADFARQIGDYLMERTAPRGLAVRVRAVHMCKTHRGVLASHNSQMISSAYYGLLKEDERLKAEFLEECRSLEGRGHS